MKMNEKFLLVFNIPNEKTVLKKRINRMLHKNKAEMIQKSVWRSESLSSLKEIAELIKREGARASVMREEILF
jgi:methanogenic corrinoid protein MtbC1